jgi:hypothetical protein
MEAGGSNSKKSNGTNAASPATEKKDYSLKEGETISVTIGVSFSCLTYWLKLQLLMRRKSQNKGRRRAPSGNNTNNNNGQLPLPFLPPPPSAKDVKRRQSRNLEEEATKMGFDDDAFGDFV